MSRTRHTAQAFVVVLLLAFARGAQAADGGEIVVHVEHGGFRWGDAAIGLLAGVGLAVAAAGCLVLVRARGTETGSRTKGENP